MFINLFNLLVYLSLFVDIYDMYNAYVYIYIYICYQQIAAIPTQRGDKLLVVQDWWMDESTGSRSWYEWPSAPTGQGMSFFLRRRHVAGQNRPCCGENPAGWAKVMLRHWKNVTVLCCLVLFCAGGVRLSCDVGLYRFFKFFPCEAVGVLLDMDGTFLRCFSVGRLRNSLSVRPCMTLIQRGRSFLEEVHCSTGPGDSPWRA